MSTIKDLFDLNGEVALVTGAGSGLGKAFSEALAEAGAKVVCADINASTAFESAESIKESYKAETLPVEVDVT